MEATQKVQDYITEARLKALSAKSALIKPEHLFYIIVEKKDDIFLKILDLCNVDLIKVSQTIEDILKVEPVVSGDTQLSFSPDFMKMMDNAALAAKNSNEQYVSILHIILGLFEISSIKKLFEKLGINDFKLKAAVDTIKKGRVANTRYFEETLNTLSRYSRDLTKLAEENKIDPVIGRDDEIRRVIQILCRRTKNNPVLIGDPGVGKTAIAEGLAVRIIREDVPEYLKHVHIYAIDLGALVAGTQYRGEFEERLKSLLNEIEQQGENAIVFIDELHTLIGAGASEGSMDASNMLKPALARGQLRCIGATTLDEYREHIEKDAALARRFQPVYVNEPNVEDTISILRGLKERYELHHGVRISDAAIVAAAQLSHRYISERFLPDKAIDLVDEAASRIRMIMDSKPEDVDKLTRKVRQLQIEKEALLKETDVASKERLKALQTELIDLEAQLSKKEKNWQAHKAFVSKIRSLKEEIDQLKSEVERLQRNGNDLSRAGEILYSVLPVKEKELKELMEKNPEATEKVGVSDIAHVVSRWTGIPVEKMIQSEADKLIHMENVISQKLIGQKPAVKAVSNAVRRARAGIQDPNRPLASFLFLGPTGVGKTELCKTLAEFLFDDKDNIVRLDMSEYMEKHAVSRLIGAPPGYVGYEEGGQLTEKVRRRPYSVVLLDEIEKAHPDVFNVLLQVLDDGRLTDSHKHTVDFRNTIIVMTSNIGAMHLMEHEEITEDVHGKVMHELKQHFKPEFLNRLDEVVVFERLKESQIKDIARIELEKLQKRLEAQNITIEFDEKVFSWLAKEGYDPIYGARPLKRVIQRFIENELALQILEHPKNKSFKILPENSKLVVEKV